MSYLKNIDEIIQDFIDLDQKLQSVEKEINNYNLYKYNHSKIHLSLTRGLNFKDEKNKKIYKIMGNHHFKKKYSAIILASKFLELNFFLPFKIEYNGKNLSIISQELIDIKSKKEIESFIQQEEIKSKVKLENDLIKNNLYYLIQKDYPKEYYKIIELIEFLHTYDIDVHNVGFLNNKIKCYDLESFIDLSIEDIVLFLKKHNCLNKLEKYPEIFYLIQG